MNTGRSEDMIRQLRTAFDHGEIEAIVDVVRKIESVCGRHSGIGVGSRDIMVEWHEGGHRFDVVFDVPGAPQLAAELVGHDIRLPQIAGRST